MNIVYTVRSDLPQTSLAQLLQLPLGLDIWQVRRDYVVLRADEPQAARLRQMGYTTEEIVETETHIYVRHRRGDCRLSFSGNAGRRLTPAGREPAGDRGTAGDRA